MSNANKAELVRLWLSKGAVKPVTTEWNATQDQVTLTFRQGDKTMPAVWKVDAESRTCTPANALAKSLEALEARLDTGKLAADLPKGWSPARPSPTQPTAVPPPPVAAPPPPPAPRPPVPVPARPQASAQPGTITLQGVMQTDTARALISRGNEHLTVGVGDEVGGYRVESIQEGRVVLGGASGRLELKLERTTPKARSESPPPVVPPSADTPPPVPTLRNEGEQAAEPAVDEDGGILLEGGWRKFEVGE